MFPHKPLERALQSCIQSTLPCVAERETHVLVVNLSSESSSGQGGSNKSGGLSFVTAWLRAFGVPWLGLRSLADHMLDHPIILRRPRVGPIVRLISGASIRLRAVAVADVLGDDDSSAAAEAFLAAPAGSRVLLLVDVQYYEASCSLDRVLLCWAWRHAFPSLPEEVVRNIAEHHLSPGALRDECTVLPLLVRRLAERRGGSDLELCIVLCNAAALVASETPAAVAAPDSLPLLSNAAASRRLQHARGLLADAAYSAAVAEVDKAEREALRAGSYAGFLPVTTPTTPILIAPDLAPASTSRRRPILHPPRLWSHQGHRLCQVIFFQELAFLLTSGSGTQRHTSSYRWWIDPATMMDDEDDEDEDDTDEDGTDETDDDD